jgi:type I restriction enzyme S subunit
MQDNGVALVDVCESVRYGYTATASHEEVGPKFLRITGIVPDAIDWGSVPFCEIDDADRNRFSLQPDDIVVARTGATVGYAKLMRDEVDAVFASYLVRFRVDPKLADPGFVGCLVESLVYKDFVKSRVGGAAQPNANAQVLGSFTFRLPTRREQERISSILSTYDDLIENNQRRMALLEEAARQLFREWFVCLRFPGHEHTCINDGVPEGWERKALGDICTDVRETVFPEELESDTPYIGLEHMPRRSIALSEWGRAEDVTSTKHRFRTGEILFGKIRPYFHKVGLAFVDGVASSDAIVIRPVSQELRGLVLLTVSSDPFVAQASQTMREGSKMPRADWKLMKKYAVAVPPSGLLGSFNGIVESVTAQLMTLTFQTQKLRIARDLLLPRLMSGEIAV